MKPVKIIKSEPILLVGMSFFGDPFSSASDWSVENEIGKLWSRFMRFLGNNSDAINNKVEGGGLYEIHIDGDRTEKDGNYEVFVGMPVETLDKVPIECVVKQLPETDYAIFTVKGEEIFSDWGMDIYRGWMPESGYETSFKYNVQLYDERFKGMDRIEESELDIYVPVKLKA